jgi:hypothetical protein
MIDITQDVMDEIDRMIQNLDTDDPARLNLLLQRSIHREIIKLKTNPAIKFGEMFREMGRGFGLLVILLAWIILIYMPGLLYRLAFFVLGIDLEGFLL